VSPVQKLVLVFDLSTQSLNRMIITLWMLLFLLMQKNTDKQSITFSGELDLVPLLALLLYLVDFNDL